jgi:hypothetical protein
VIRLSEGNFVGSVRDVAQEWRISHRLTWPRSPPRPGPGTCDVVGPTIPGAHTPGYTLPPHPGLGTRDVVATIPGVHTPGYMLPLRAGTIIDTRWIEIIDGAFLDGGRLSGLSSGSTRGIAPPAFALASPGRVRAMRGRRREGLGTTTFGDQSNRGGLLDAPMTVPFLYSLWGTGTVFLSQVVASQRACGRAGQLARATPAPRPGARS